MTTAPNTRETPPVPVKFMGREVGRVLSKSLDGTVVMEITDRLIADALKDTARPGDYSVPETTIADVMRSISDYRKALGPRVVANPEIAEALADFPVRVVVNANIPPDYIYVIPDHV